MVLAGAFCFGLLDMPWELSFLCWIITPIGITLIVWILLKKVPSRSFPYYLKIAIIWTIMAVIFDYFFLVKLFKPEDGYYKLDVYLYYLLTFTLPLLVGWYKSRGIKESVS